MNKRGLLLALAGYFGFVFIITFFVAYFNPHILNNFHFVFYFILLLGGVVFSAGQSFSHLNTSEKSIAHLSLPASTFEKFLVPWILSGIAWSVVAIVSYLLFAVGTNGLWAWVFGFEYETFLPFNFADNPLFVKEIYTSYVLTHALFFLGATAFQRYAIPKTFLAYFIVSNTIGVILLIVGLLLFGTSGHISFPVEHPDTWQNSLEQLFDFVVVGNGKIILAGIFSAIFYVAAFFKIKEREV